MLSSIEALAFDLDGTLVDSLPDLAAAANAMREHFGLAQLSAERVASHVGDGLAKLVHRTLTDEKDGVAEVSQWEAGLAFFARYYREHLADLTRPYEGVAEALQLLRAKRLPLAVVTNKPAAFAVPLLEQLGLAEHFSLILGGDSLPEKKPSALPLVHTAEVFGVAPEKLAMVGDSINDVLSARAAGCPVVAVSYGYGSLADGDADATVGNLVELYDLLKNT
ncbi:phosphoglycolate phosphatase [Crenobacter cavernae]|uniref:Phosphoglycolate phosphatase n=1 Tax=Crenobacter cavernae TaxID=2290923 RepID=A0A345Y800_9NEIS|nr:phosphoglycolate phosphatase [Crenobacter cavernae]AXK40052.1 phosphoglycolate phosphatase [Crenobacter cavernae]